MLVRPQVVLARQAGGIVRRTVSGFPWKPTFELKRVTMKRFVLAVLAVFVAWSVLDFIIHGLILASSYQATARLWRPMGEMKFWVMHLAGLITALAFVCIYALLVAEKGIGSGVKYGLLFGLGTGVSMGFGTYSFMPIPLYMAVAWFMGTLVETLVGGIIVGSIIRK
jgi:hypothetical protein